MINQQIVDDAFNTAVEKGWWDDPRSGGTLISLMHSELSEALEEWRDHGDDCLTNPNNPGYLRFVGEDLKPEGFWSEQADLIIRIADLAGHEGIKVYEYFDDVGKYLHIDPDTDEVGDWLADQHRLLSKAFTEWRIHGNPITAEHPYYFANRIRSVFYWHFLATTIHIAEVFATKYNVDLWGIVKTKMEYNTGREYRHGNKHA